MVDQKLGLGHWFEDNSVFVSETDILYTGLRIDTTAG